MSDSDKTRTQILGNLAAINTLANQLQDRAIDQAGHPLMPGGEAMTNLAGCASLEGWANRNDHRERQGHYDDTEDPENTWPPIQRLWYWTEAWREQHDQPTDQRPTLQTETGFLAKIIDWIIDHEPHLEDFRADVARARGNSKTSSSPANAPHDHACAARTAKTNPASSKCGPNTRQPTPGNAHAVAENSPTTNIGVPNGDKCGSPTRHAGSPQTKLLTPLDMAPPLHKTAATKLLEHADIQRKAIGRRIMIWLPDVITVHNLERVNQNTPKSVLPFKKLLIL